MMRCADGFLVTYITFGKKIFMLVEGMWHCNAHN